MHTRLAGLIATGVAVGVVLVFALSQVSGWPLWLPLFVVIALGAVAVMFQVSLAQLGVVAIGLFCLTASWDLVTVAGAKPRQVFLLVGVALLVVGHALTHRPRVPWWIHAYGLSAIVATLLQVLFVVDPEYISSRYAASEAGVSLGERAGDVASLASLVFNTYVVPVAVAMACACLPRARDWLVGAYVGGAAWSAIAAFLGFIGLPQMLELLVVPVPAGTRALGFTYHPLHLATASVLAFVLALWLATRPSLLLRWVGRGAVIALPLGVYASGSRAGFGGLIVACACAVLLLPSARRRGHILLGSAAGMLALMILFVPQAGTAILRTVRVLGDSTSEVSDQGRSELLVQGLADFAHSPVFGIGVRYLAESHVLYIGVLAAGGLLMFIGLLLFMGGSIREAHEAATVDRQFSGALLATLLMSLVYWTVALGFQTASTQILYGFVVAAGATVMARARTNAPDSSEAQGAALEGTLMGGP